MLEVWTDGACQGNGKEINYGGWAYVIVRDKQCIAKCYGSEKNTTNNRMELKAVIEGLRYALKNLEFGEKLKVISDSSYVINCFKERWYLKWKKYNFVLVKNPDLWQTLISIVELFGDDIEFFKVRGHKGFINNEIADMLAVKGAEEARRMK